MRGERKKRGLVHTLRLSSEKEEDRKVIPISGWIKRRRRGGGALSYRVRT